MSSLARTETVLQTSAITAELVLYVNQAGSLSHEDLSDATLLSALKQLKVWCSGAKLPCILLKLTGLLHAPTGGSIVIETVQQSASSNEAGIAQANRSNLCSIPPAVCQCSPFWKLIVESWPTACCSTFSVFNYHFHGTAIASFINCGEHFKVVKQCKHSLRPANNSQGT